MERGEWLGNVAVVGLLAVISLYACSRQASNDERLEVADVNARRAIARAEELSSQVNDLEARVSDLEANQQ